MKATFGAGCFWHVEEIFRKTNGVKSTQVGYSGGMKQNPTYEEVCTDTTGHVESVEVDYDPEEISYEDLLKIFWNNQFGEDEINRDESVKDLLRNSNIEIKTFDEQVVFETGSILTGEGKPYSVFTPFKRKWIERITS